MTVKIMTSQEFQNASYTTLASLTGIASHQWCRYFRSRSTVHEKTLNQAAKKLGFEPHELLREINLRRTLLKEN